MFFSRSFNLSQSSDLNHAAAFTRTARLPRSLLQIILHRRHNSNAFHDAGIRRYR
jgi:hypothetical protein